MREYTNGPTPPFTPNPDPTGPLCQMPDLADQDREFLANPIEVLKSSLMNVFQDVQVVPYTGHDVEGVRLTLSPIGAAIFVKTMTDNLLKALTLKQALDELGLSREQQLEIFMKQRGRAD